MKKTLVAVAAMAATAAFAQSSVTLYGVADAYFGGEKGAAQVRDTVVNSGGLSESRVGISIKEDLGADLSAFAVVERGINLDKGTLAGNRKAVVGLGGSFGAVSLGQQRTPLHNAIEGLIDNQANSAFSAVGSVLDADQANFADATDANYAIAYTDSIRYDSPNFEGFSGAIQVGLNENKTATTSAGRGVSLNLGYDNGPLAVGYAHQNDKADGSVKANKTHAIGASYDFGVAKANLGVIQQQAGGSDVKARTYNIGASVPFDAFTIVAQFANTKESGNGKADGNARSIALEGRYALSKRTTTYLGLNQTEDKINLTSKVKTNRFGVGVRHVF